jgi:serine/threonine protein kinase
MTTDPIDGELVPLGDGEACTVLAGVDSATEEAYAVKVLPGRLDRRTRAALDAELRTLARLRETAPILAADRVMELGDGRRGLRMELCSQSLPELIAAFGPLPVGEAVELGTALARSLAAAHAAGVLHGGVTPGNVLFRSSGEPVLADFGLTLRRAFPGDPARVMDYLAPETLRDGTVNERCDLYGLGAVLYLALTGRSPHPATPGEPEPERMMRVLTEPVPVDGLPPGLGELVAALLDHDPARRPADPAGVVTPLAALGAGGSTPAAPRPAGEPLLVFGPRRRSRLPVPPKVIALIVLIAVAGLLFWLNRPGDLDMPAAAPPTAASATAEPSHAPVLLELADATDRGNVVDLAWRSSEPLEFVIIVATEGGPSRPIYVHRVTTYSVPVDPVRKYCFMVQGTNGVGVFSSAPKAIRGAVCRE